VFAYKIVRESERQRGRIGERERIGRKRAREGGQ